MRSTLLLLAAFQTKPAAAPEVRVDARIELVSIVFRLAGHSEFNQESSDSPYAREVKERFGRFAGHPAVERAADLRKERGVSFDAVPSLAVHLVDAESFAERVPFDAPPARLDARWSAEEARAFVGLLRAFSRESGFPEFFAAHAGLYRKTEERLRALLAARLDVGWFDAFFGAKPGATFRVIPGLLFGGCNYGVGVRLPDGREEVLPSIGCWKWDGEGVPLFGEEVLPTVVHEFSHSYANPLVDLHAEALERSGERIFPTVSAVMRPQAYGTWRAVLYESLVRASVVRYLTAHEGKGAAAKEVDEDGKRGFAWVGDLAALLAEYERDRKAYPDLDAFAPRLVAFFEALAERSEKVAADAPKVVRTTPAGGASGIPADLGSIVVEFDRPMQTGGYAVTGGGEEFPEIDRSRAAGFDDSGKIFTLPVKLRPGRRYRFGLNGASHRGFQSREGVPLVPLDVTFATAE
ncbi:MAG TPA: DUF4932 domain-containing protein [Planctomycetota bacterium]|jgi:hypothetical protein|nr:DUF4932 domain-containing protein [Planctomycetota bacterium]